MKIRQIRLKNWMNFKSLETAELGDRIFLIGPNASGKSNFLDALRFLRDVALPSGVKPGGGGLQKAVNDRGGLSKLRYLNAKQDTEVLLDATIVDGPDKQWRYTLGFKDEGKANNRIIVTSEIVSLNGTIIHQRPNDDDRQDPERLTQSYLEQINVNLEFRELARFFSEIAYLHLVPQLLKFASAIGGNVVEQDPFGQGFLQRIAATSEKTRNSRLRRIQGALDSVVPLFKELRFQKDPVSGRPHIEANFAHWRPKGAWQRENQFSDGTLRLIGLLWSLMDGGSLLLLEEPELSLNEGIVRNLPKLLQRVQKQSKNPSQIIVTTHSEALLDDAAIPAEEVIRLQLSAEGTEIRELEPQEAIMMKSGMSVGQVMLPATRPENVNQLQLTL